MKQTNGGVCAAKGFSANGIHCGIRRNKTKRDIALIYSDVVANAAAVYTQNLVKGAPLTVTKNNIANGKAQAVICNSGNANTCNANGIEIAEQMCELLANEIKFRSTHLIRCTLSTRTKGAFHITYITYLNVNSIKHFCSFLRFLSRM